MSSLKKISVISLIRTATFERAKEKFYGFRQTELLSKKKHDLEYIECMLNRKNTGLPYLTALSPQTPRIIFKARFGVFDTKVNFKDKYSPDFSCAICKEGREILEHILQRSRLPECKARETVCGKTITEVG